MILYLSTFTFFTFFALRIAAQNVTDVPQCAQQAAGTSISSTGCQLTDISCICKSQSFLKSFLPAIDSACSQEDVQKTLAFAQSFCAAASISLTLPTATTSGSAPTAVNTAGTTTSMASISGKQTATTTSAGSPTVASATATGTARSLAAGGLSGEGWWRDWMWVWVWVGAWICWV